MEYLSHPNESVEYRKARNGLLDAEIFVPTAGNKFFPKLSCN
jgi:hypothetical protein